MTKLYFLGIGGTAMGALACACKDAGFMVSGSDSGVYEPMSSFLQQRDITFFHEYAESNIQSFQPDVIVVGNAMSRGNVELEFALDARLTLRSMPDLLREEFIKKHCSVVVSGTHGKTTVSSIASWMLASSGLPTGFFIGAVTGNFGLGCRAVVPSSTDGFFVTEGDEYDSAFFDKRSKFLSYRPDIAIINNIEFDHADIFSSLQEIQKSFRLFARLVPRSGLIIANGDDPNVLNVLKDSMSTVESFGFNASNIWRAVDIHYTADATHFTVLHNGFIYSRFSTQLLGEHNVRNVLGTVAMAHRVGLKPEHMQSALDSFILPKRRLELIGTFGPAVVVDDFAHHPTAIRLTIRAALQRYPEHRIIACFEPRSNTTSRNFFQHELVECFEDADVVILGCVNRPERYPEAERLNRELIAEQLRDNNKEVFVVDQSLSTTSDWGRTVHDYLKTIVKDGDVILFLSNGDFGGARKMLLDTNINTSNTIT